MLFVMLFAFVTEGMAQGLTVKDFSVLPRDIEARTKPRTDADGKGCALIKVDVVGIADMTFKEAVRNVDYALSQYKVYVPEDTKVLTYSYGKGKYKGEVRLDSYGVDIIEKTTYRLQFERQNRLRSAVFSVSPKNATVILDKKELTLNEDGMAETDKPIGKYEYLVKAPGYHPQSGTVELTDGEVSTLTVVNLEQITYDVNISSNNFEGYLFVDNIPYGRIGRMTNLPLSTGKHEVRLIAQTYKEAKQDINVKGSQSVTVPMTKMREKEIRHREERSRRRVNVRNAFYMRGGYSMYDKENYLAYNGSGDFQIDFINHMFGIFGIHWGFGVGYIFRSHDDAEEYNANLPTQDDDGNEVYQEASGAIYLDVPLQAGLSFPFGNYNLHMFSVFAGGYYRFICNPGKDFISFDDEETDFDPEVTNKHDYGLRATARLDIGKFSIGADISKSLAKEFKGIYFGATIGWKFYM